MPTPEQRRAFVGALAAALREADVNGRALGEALGLSPSSVSKWLRGKTTPAPETLARLEKIVGQEPGSLSRTLGYVPAEVPRTSQAPRVADAVGSDPRLGPRERAVLLAVYRELVRQYSPSVGGKTPPSA